MKDLLMKMYTHLRHIDEIGLGMCMEAKIMTELKIITAGEQQILVDYLMDAVHDRAVVYDLHGEITHDALFEGYYLFPKGDKQSRLLWLTERMNELTETDNDNRQN